MKKEVIELAVESRNTVQQSELTNARKNMLTPAVIYGPDIKENVSIYVKENEFVKTFRKCGENHPITLKVDGKKKIKCIVKDYDYNILKNKLIHIDFYTVSAKHAIKTQVPVEFIGTSAGEKAGGVAEKFVHHINVEGKLSKLPESIKIDISEFEIGSKLHISDLIKDAKGYKILDNEDEVLIVIKGKSESTGDEISGEEADEALADDIFGD